MCVIIVTLVPVFLIMYITTIKSVLNILYLKISLINFRWIWVYRVATGFWKYTFMDLFSKLSLKSVVSSIPTLKRYYCKDALNVYL